jgi:hypothetical protein
MRRGGTQHEHEQVACAVDVPIHERREPGQRAAQSWDSLHEPSLGMTAQAIDLTALEGPGES